MKKIILILLLLLIPINVFANNIEIESKSAIVVNRENNEILFEKNVKEKLPIASLTKIMTTLVTLENISSLDNKVVVKGSDLYNLLGYQVIGLTSGMEVSYKDLLYSTMIYSAGDSARVLANHVFNDYDVFIEKMNELAKKLEMKDTQFSNPVGYDTDNYSTSYDLYLLLDYALENDNFYDIYTTKSYKMEVIDKTITSYIDGLITEIKLDNYNINFKGFKSGYTNKSGLSLSGISDIENNELLIITIGAMSDKEKHDNVVDSLNILKEIKNNYSKRVILEEDKLIDNIIFKKGNKEINYEIRSLENIEHYIKDNINLDYLKVYYEGKTELDNSIKNGDIIGNIKIYYLDNLLDNVSVNYNEKYLVKENKDYKNLIIFVGICLLGLIVFRKKN